MSNAQDWSLLGIVGTMATAIVALTGVSLLAFRAQFASLKDYLDARFTAVDVRFTSVDERLDRVDQRLDRVDQRLDRVDRRLDSLDRDVQTLFRDRY